MPESTMVGRTTGRFGAAQLVAIEGAAMAVAAAAYTLPLVPGTVVVGAVLLVTFGVLGRAQGGWVYETLGARSRLARRRKTAARAVHQMADPRLAAVAPGLTVTTVSDRRGAFGVGQDALGWFAAVAVVPTVSLSGGHGVHMRLSRLAALAADPALPSSSLQLVVRHIPLPAATLHPDTACAASYRELQQAAAQAPVHREVWVATRLSPRAAAAAAADRGGGLTGVHRSLAAALNRLTTSLGEATSLSEAASLSRTTGLNGTTGLSGATGSNGATSVAGAKLSYRTLDGGELLQALAETSDLGVGPGAHEHWSHVRTDRATHVSFAVRHWPAQAPADVLGWLAAVPTALSVTTAMVFRQTSEPGRTVIRVLVRVAAAPTAIDECVRQLQANATRLRLRLIRLNGEQAAGLYSTAPTGATVGLVPW